MYTSAIITVHLKYFPSLFPQLSKMTASGISADLQLCWVPLGQAWHRQEFCVCLIAMLPHYMKQIIV